MGTDNERNLNIAAVRAAIEGGLRNLERDPERGVRNMLDLGKYFSRTHRQRSFFQMAQRMLGRKRSQYMQLVKRTVTDVDHDTLKPLGITAGPRVQRSYAKSKLRADLTCRGALL